MKKTLLVSLIAIAIVAMATTGVNAQNTEPATNIQLEVKPYLKIERKLPKPSIVVGESEFTKRAKSQQPSSVASRGDVIPRERPQEQQYDLGTLRTMYRDVAARYNIPWELLEAVHQVETGKSTTCKSSSAGAKGPFQFLPSTFAHYSPGGNICDLSDSMDAAARLLAASGASEGDIDSALFSYNHSSSYVALVKSVMNSI